MQDDRQFLAILIADAAGYTRLMALNEPWAVRELRACQALMADSIAVFGGFVVDTAGDGILAAFPSSVRAVECALAIQHAVAARNAQQAPQEKMRFRIGINPGEVIRQDGRIFGDVVNVAARIASHAEPGSITVSSTTVELVSGKTECRFDDIGTIPLKNVDTPPRLYRVLSPGAPPQERRPVAATSRPAMAPAGAEGGITLSDLAKQGSVSLSDRTRAAAESRIFLFIDKFINLAGGDNLDLFALGLEQGLIADLSEDTDITVRAERSEAITSADAEAANAKDPKFGARLRLHGILQLTREGLRINAALVDMATGDHLWAEHYEGDGTTDFQVTTCAQIVSAVRLKLLLGKFSLRDRAPSDSPAVRQIVDLAIINFFQQTKESLAKAISLSERALAIDPASVRGKRTLTASISASITLGALPRSAANLERALLLAQEVVLAAPQDEIARCELAWALTNLGRHAEACDHLRRAIELNPASPNARADLAEQLALLGHPAEALRELQQAFALSGYDPLEIWRHNTMATARFSLGDYEEALEVARHMVRAEPAFVRGVLFWTASAAALDLAEEARRAAAHLMKLAPDLRLSGLSPAYVTRYAVEEHQQRLLDMLRKAGVPD